MNPSRVAEIEVEAGALAQLFGEKITKKLGKGYTSSCLRRHTRMYTE